MTMKGTAAVILALALVAGSTTALAAGGRGGFGQGGGNMPGRGGFPTRTEQGITEVTESEKPVRPEKPELSEEQKAEMIESIKTKLSGMLENGEITEEQYNEYLAKLEAGEIVRIGLGREPRGGKEPGEGEKPGMPELTEEQKAEMIESIKTKLSEMLENGEVAEEQYNEYLAKLEAGEIVRMGLGREPRGGKELGKGFGRSAKGNRGFGSAEPSHRGFNRGKAPEVQPSEDTDAAEVSEVKASVRGFVGALGIRRDDGAVKF